MRMAPSCGNGRSVQPLAFVTQGADSPGWIAEEGLIALTAEASSVCGVEKVPWPSCRFLKYRRNLLMMACSSERRPRAVIRWYPGIAMLERIPMSSTTIISSTIVKPRAGLKLLTIVQYGGVVRV